MEKRSLKGGGLFLGLDKGLHVTGKSKGNRVSDLGYQLVSLVT